MLMVRHKRKYGEPLRLGSVERNALYTIYSFFFPSVDYNVRCEALLPNGPVPF